MNWQAYDPTWAFHTALRARAARWQRRQQIGSEQLLSIEAAYPLPYYQPGWPVRVALFIFTWIALVMAGSILALFLAIPFSKFLSLSNSEMVHPIGLLFILLCFTALEQLIRKRRFYHAGTDTALLYAGLGIGSALLADAYFTGSGHTFFTVEESTTHYFAANGFVPLTLGLLLMLAAAVRYADVLATAVACGAAGLLVPECALTIPSVVPLLPFLLMATAGAAWLGSRAVGLRLSGTALADYYAACLRVVKLLALTVFYLSGNYLVVREGYESLYSYQPTQNPFAPLFWAFTAIVPLLYLWWGLRRGLWSRLR